jgi:predicted aspartyl protease
MLAFSAALPSLRLRVGFIKIGHMCAAYIFLLLTILHCFQAHSQTPDSQLKSIYEKHHWFSLRDDVARMIHPPAFYQAAIEAAFEDRDAAERDLGNIILQSPHSDDAYEAQEILATLYFRHGEYKRGLSHLHAMLRERPDSVDVKNALLLYTAMGRVDQSTAELTASSTQMIREDGNIYLPLSINGTHASYAFDTGANQNGISESEARRLGMSLTDVSSQVEDSAGHHLGLRVAVAQDLRVGGLHLRDVAFAVFPDAQPPFNELPQQKRGLIGMPILIAMRTIRWSSDGTFSFSFPSEARNLGGANLTFEQCFPVTRGYFHGEAIDLTVDSGAQRTVLGPPFAAAFAKDLPAVATEEPYQLTGIGGSASYASLLVPSLDLHIGGHPVKLIKAHVLKQKSSDESQWTDGNLGIDLLNQSHSTTFDFGAMKLTLR